MDALPTSKDDADDYYTFTRELDGTSYEFQFYWNDRASAWFVSLFLTDGTKLLSGIKVTVGLTMFKWWVDQTNGFAGAIYVMDSSGTDADPGRYDLAPDGRCTMYYLEEQDLLALSGDTSDDSLAALADMGLTSVTVG